MSLVRLVGIYRTLDWTLLVHLKTLEYCEKLFFQCNSIQTGKLLCKCKVNYFKSDATC